MKRIRFSKLQFLLTFTLIISFTQFLSVNAANACSMTGSDTTAVGVAPDGCFIGDIRYESIKVSQASITKSGNDTGVPYTLTVSLSVNAPSKLYSLQIVAMHSNPTQNRYTMYTNENPFQGDNACIGAPLYRVDMNPNFFSNVQLSNNRNVYTFNINANVSNSCKPGNLYFEAVASLNSSTGSIIRGLTLPGNQLTVLPAPKIEGGYCEFDDIDTQSPNPDGSIWFCQRASAYAPALWHLVTGSTATTLTDCAFKCTTETLFPSQINPQLLNVKLNPIGSTCKKVNQTLSNGKSTEVCTKSGAKLLWKTASQDHSSTTGNNASPQSFGAIACNDFKQISPNNLASSINFAQDMATQFGMAARLSPSYTQLLQAANQISAFIGNRQNQSAGEVGNVVAIVNSYCGTSISFGQ
jgi:hypothetical protein